MRQKILIADDEDSVRRVLARAFSPEVYELLCASDGKAALDMASMRNPDLILLDINMPGKNGREVLRALRRNAQTRMTPVIMLTACGVPADKIGGLEMGADDYITKPFMLAELKARVAGALRRNRRALSANPITKLPGSPAIEEEVNRLITASTPFAFLYVDINYFKAYNDAYGYERGDRVIRETAEILLDSFHSDGGEAGFVGHIGGDDFVVITDLAQAPYLAARITSEFDKRSPGFYTSLDRRRGFIRVKNREGRWQRFSPLSLSVGIVTTRHRVLDHYAKVVQVASEMKVYCKSNPSHHLSRFAFDRRNESENEF
jgi:diguanylate cyclase (GGDEF)-like protein